MSEPKRFTLVRDPRGVDRTFGHWMLDDPWTWLFETLEPGGADIRHPLMPPGFKILVPHGWEPGATVKYTRTWAVVGASTSAQPLGGSEAAGALRGVPHSAALLHPGNLDDHTLMCILPGLSRGMLSNEPAVLSSGPALDKLRETIGGPHVAYLRILEG